MAGSDRKKHWIWNHRIGMAAGGIYSTLEDIVAYAKGISVIQLMSIEPNEVFYEKCN